jgi:hypothetical protein
MAKNTGNEHRCGAVKERSQTFNSKTNCFVKRDTKTGKFVSCKKDEPFKGVTKEKLKETSIEEKSEN